MLPLLFLVLRPALSNPMFSPKNFEHTNSCNDKYLVEGKDFLIFEFEATGSNSTYPFNQGLFGPQFYYTTAIYNNIFSPCGGFDYDDACTNRRGE
ncbi:hypothetical protein RRG08_049195, partial [Elysia crispata]